MPNFPNFQKIAVATAGAALGLGGIGANIPATAAIITYDFSVNGEPSGFFSFDDTQSPVDIIGLGYGLGYGDEYFYLTDFEFTLPSGRTFELDEIKASSPAVIVNQNESPGVSFLGVNLLGLNVGNVGSDNGFFAFISNTLRGSELEGSLANEFGTPTTPNPGGTGYGVTYTLRSEEPHTSVPEPSTIAGLSMLGLGWLLRKKVASSPTT